MLGKNVLEAARERISWTFDEFPRVYCSFSAGKDSTAMMHLVMEEAKRRNRRIGVLFIDWECQFSMTIKHARKMFGDYSGWIDPYWVSIPLTLSTRAGVDLLGTRQALGQKQGRHRNLRQQVFRLLQRQHDVRGVRAIVRAVVRKGSANGVLRWDQDTRESQPISHNRTKQANGRRQVIYDKRHR